ncbi:MAG: class I SAM-dependent methyltransferase [Bacteroidota bacterium]
MSRFFQLKSYLNYWLDAVNLHSLQSPFVYEIYKHVIDKRKRLPPDPSIEKIREKFKASSNSIEIDDFGSGSRKNNGTTRKITDIALYGITESKYSRIMSGLIEYMDYRNVVELGTSLGINTLYLSKKSHSKITTFEGSSSLVNIASEVLGHQRKNVNVIEGNIDITLPEYLEESEKIDFVYIDANHQYNATLRYFDLVLRKSHDQTCFVFDDIHLSREMASAWIHIIGHYQVTLTLDLYQIGIVFINPELRKQHYVLET